MRAVSTLREARVALGQVNVPPRGGPTLGLQPLDRVRDAILALRWAQIANALRHALNIPGPTGPKQGPTVPGDGGGILQVI